MRFRVVGVDAFNDPKAWKKKLEPFMLKSGLELRGYIVERKLSGQKLRRRTGALVNSLEGDGGARGTGQLYMGAGIFTGSPASKYAAIQEFGTVGKGGIFPTITPKRAKALTIPVGKALTPAGVARWPRAKDTPFPLKFIPFKRGDSNIIGGLYDARIGRSIQSQHLYWLLARYVDIKPQRYAQSGFEEFLGPWIVRLQREIAYAIEAV